MPPALVGLLLFYFHKAQSLKSTIVEVQPKKDRLYSIAGITDNITRMLTSKQ